MKFLPPEFYVKIYYEYYTGKKLNLKNPVEFNEKIQWLKVYYQPPILTQLVNKYEVRTYVEEKIGAQYLNKLIAYYKSASEVDFNNLPDKFVIKGVHGFHFNLIVPDKTLLNKKRAKYLLHKWMRKNQYYRGGLEWAYKNCKPGLVAETFLEEPGKTVINDYKFFCFNGKPRFVQIDIGRGESDLRAYFDLNWQLLPFNKGKVNFTSQQETKPENFDEMVLLAEKLADSFPFVRVDFYSISGKTIFGEMTFYPADGRTDFLPDEYNKIIGDYLVLPKKKPGQKVITQV